MLRKIFQFIGLIAALLTLLPLIAADYWWIRVFDFPHLQLSGLTLIAIVLFFFTFNTRWINDYIYVAILLGCFVFQFTKFIDYTPFVAVEVKDSTPNIGHDATISIYTANVLQENKNSKELFDEIESKNPDLIVFTETNQRWTDDIRKNIGDRYPYKIEQPQDNSYGMLVYSQLELTDTKVLFKVDSRIPSMEAKVSLKNGKQFQLYAIHPTPPMLQHNPMSSDRDKELMLTSIASNKSSLPVMVLGDFNDVAWSDSTQLTKTIGKLLDLRIGRGFFNTYHAQYPIFRWPLDHILTSAEFRLKDAGTGVDFESDHFPSWAVLTFEPDIADEQNPEEPSEKDWNDAKAQMDKNELESLLKSN